MNPPTLLTLDVRYEQDVVAVRQRARQVAALLGLGTQDQTGFATAVSEIVRNAFRYAGGGRVEFLLGLDTQPQTLVVRATDRGPGIADLKSILKGQYKSATGMGLGLIGSQRLCDTFDVQSEPGRGTTVTLGKHLPRRATPLTADAIGAFVAELARRGPRSALDEVQEQNRELMRALDALQMRQVEVERLNTELADTNRGVVALYAELDDRAESLRQASEYKSRFLSDMTHELRTPLNAVISLSRLLLDRADGELTEEQDKQVTYIHRSATSLGEMVNGLLDLAKIESGRVDVQAGRFTVADLLAALRGMFRPLTLEHPATLIIEEPAEPIEFFSDEGKLTQILRNLISNALKFTERGSVGVRCEPVGALAVAFTVADTGIGMAADDLERIFDDFTQIDSGLQRQVRGTGLGLSLAKKFSDLLGGEISVRSTPGVGTTFVVTLPREWAGRADSPATIGGSPAGEDIDREDSQ